MYGQPFQYLISMYEWCTADSVSHCFVEQFFNLPNVTDFSWIALCESKSIVDSINFD